MIQQPTLYHWNPKRRKFAGRFLRRLPFFERPNNFGDLIGPLITNRILDRHGFKGKLKSSSEPDMIAPNLLTVGSILHFAKNGDTIWGSGRNGKISDAQHHFDQLDVRMVRGPLTQRFLKSKGISVPNIFGDPALLLAELFPKLSALTQEKLHPLTIIPNLNEISRIPAEYEWTSPTEDLWKILSRIAQSELVISSSLHGIVVAEALGVAVRPLRPLVEPSFKYIDYFFGTGRKNVLLYETVEEAIGGTDHDKPSFQPDKMLTAFPYELFSDA